MAEHVRFHMTSVPVSGSSEFSLFSYREEGSEREREERDGERAEKGLIREGGFGRDFQAPPPVSAAAYQRPAALGGAGTTGEGTRFPERGGG